MSLVSQYIVIWRQISILHFPARDWRYLKESVCVVVDIIEDSAPWGCLVMLGRESSDVRKLACDELIFFCCNVT